MKSCHRSWQTSSEFVLRLADLGAAQIDSSIRRTNRYNELCLRQFAAQWPAVLAPTAGNAAELHKVSRQNQDELLEDGCNLLQIAVMVESEMMYWTDRLTQAWFDEEGGQTEH